MVNAQQPRFHSRLPRATWDCSVPRLTARRWLIYAQGGNGPGPLVDRPSLLDTRAALAYHSGSARVGVGWQGRQADEGVEAEVFQEHGFKLASFDDFDAAVAGGEVSACFADP